MRRPISYEIRGHYPPIDFVLEAGATRTLGKERFHAGRNGCRFCDSLQVSRMADRGFLNAGRNFDLSHFLE
jgi:hypothetical protein